MKNSSQQAYWSWILLSSFFAYQMVLRIYPGIFIDDIRGNFQMSAKEFAKLSTYYLYIYGVLQIPVGIILDRIGIRVVALWSIGLCLLGNYLLLQTHSILCAQWSRILVGAGSACTLIASFKVASDHFSERKKVFLMGLTFGIGNVVVISSSILLVKWAQRTDWRSAIDGLQYIGYIFLLICWFKLHGNKQTVAEKSTTHGSVLKDLTRIIFNPKIFLYGILSIGLYSPIAAVSDLWGTGFFMTKFGLPHLHATKINMMIFVGFGIGSVIIPLICHGNRVLRGIRYSGLAMVVLFAMLLYGHGSCLGLKIIMCLLGFLSCTEVLCFALASRLAVPETSGLINGWVNTFNMVGGAIIQQAVGWSLDYQWRGVTSAEGIKLYQPHEYVNAFLVLWFVIIICTVVSLCMRTHRHTGK